MEIVMQALLAPLKELAEFGQMTDILKKGGQISLTGCVDSQKLHMISGLSDGFRVKVIATFDELKAREIFEEYKFYDRNVCLYPPKDLIFYQADIHGSHITEERVKVLRRLWERKPLTIVTTYSALMCPCAVWREEDPIMLERGGMVDLDELSHRLVDLGYHKEYQVENPGDFSIRGGIIDVFDLTETNPIRIELWGDEIESLRSFDILSQRSIEKLESVTIYPATEFVLSESRIERGMERILKEERRVEKKFRDEINPEAATRIKKTIAEFQEQLTELGNYSNVESYIHYFYEDEVTLPRMIVDLYGADRSLFAVDEPGRVMEQAQAVENEFRDSYTQRAMKGYILPSQMNLLYSGEQVAADLMQCSLVTLATLGTGTNSFKISNRFDINAVNIAPYNKSFETLVKDLKRYKKAGFRVFLLSGSRTRAVRLSENLRENEITAVYTSDENREVKPGEVITCYGHVNRGFEYPLLKLVVISETDIFGAEKKKKKKRFNQGNKIADFNDLKVGDIVVHESHGLGEYKGIEKVEVERIVRDFLKIVYADGGVLYIPATGLDAIQKYSSADGAKPKLNRLAGKDWERTTAKVKTAVAAVAKDLVELYATRQASQGYKYDKDTYMQREFEEMFPYEETEDQINAILDTKMDMESGKIMDRLICGDVGYGKTEIAIRAAFKAVQEHKQVVYLVPTTILAQQHYNTFTQRMKDFAVNVELLSRFRTPGEIKRALDGLKKGNVDIVIGTHRVLSKDVVFKDLGLLIIDEEQRFGVAHKEKIKKLRENVDVLTLTATPIPRTLHMSLIGVRDMSVLEEAPEDRLPIQTFVCEYNEEMVREAISRELARGGQVYYVYNRVNNIADIAAQLQELLPNANVAYAHGQMNEHELENIMYEFISGNIDVLVATTIIETGLDISNVNTMIIHDSENLGLSQLYQLRGRVGRSNRTAYAFLMYKKDKMLSEVAEKRLSAIRDFTELGSGFKIAMRDLEIRGAGNLLGTSQHGHMAAVGYDMYCKLLNDAVKNLKGIEVVEGFTTSIDLNVDAYIPVEYIVNETQKLDIYKRIADIENDREREDMKDELLDRFGQIPPSVENLLRIALIRVSAHKLYLSEVKGRDGRIIFKFTNNAEINVASIPTMLGRYGGDLTFSPVGTPFFTFKYKSTGLEEKDAELLLELTEKLLAEMSQVLLKPAETEEQEEE